VIWHPASRPRFRKIEDSGVGEHAILRKVDGKQTEGKQMMKRRLVISAALVSAAGAFAIGCGGGDDDSTTQAQTNAETSASQGGSLEISMGDYFFVPSDVTATAGSVTISAPNNGKIEHELVLAKTNTDPANLPTTADGEVDEAKLEAEGADAGEIADVAAGDTKKGTFKLTPGQYVMFCNLPGHYTQGMYGTLTVK
jgi:uncharacterized cupredoxin-like copper-binding protein